MKNNKNIEITGAKAHNLKGVTLSIPRGKFVVLTGLSGSGKSSLAFDTIYAEGQRRYMDTLSTYAKHFMGILEKPEVESITGLSPIIAIEQKTTGNNPRSTVGTITEMTSCVFSTPRHPQHIPLRQGKPWSAIQTSRSSRSSWKTITEGNVTFLLRS